MTRCQNGLLIKGLVNYQSIELRVRVNEGLQYNGLTHRLTLSIEMYLTDLY